MNKRKLVAVIVFLIFLVSIAGYKLYQQQADSLVYTGTVEVTKVDITTKTNGYIESLTVKEGDKVAAGELIATIDKKDLAMQLDRDCASWEKAKVQLIDLEKGARAEEISSSAANVASLVSIHEKASADYKRYQALYESGAIAQQTLDNAKSAAEVAYQNLQAARENEKLLLAGSRSDVILAQKLEVERSEAVLKASQVAYQDREIYSPINGTILSKNFEQGEYMNVGNAVASLADLSDCWVKIYIPATELAKVKLGQSAKILVDAYPKEDFNGRITEISDKAEFTPRQSITKHERANMVFAVKVAIENHDGVLKPGMPADVIFDD